MSLYLIKIFLFFAFISSCSLVYKKQINNSSFNNKTENDTIIFDGFIKKDSLCLTTSGVKLFNKTFKPRFNDSIYLDNLYSNIKDSFLACIIVNTTKDTLYFYSEIISKNIVFRPFTHRVDTSTKRYYFSLLPRKGDFIDGITHTKYNKFVKLPPNSYYNIKIKNKREYYSERYTGIHYSDPFDINKPNQSSLFYLDYAIRNYEIFFQVAIYPSVSLLCEHRYTSNKKYWELFHKQEKTFYIINGKMKNFAKNY